MNDNYRKRGGILASLILCLMIAAGMHITGLAEELPAAQAQALTVLQTAYPNVLTYQEGSQITRLYGCTFGTGDGAVESAENFRLQYAPVLGVAPDELKPVGPDPAGDHTLGLMHNGSTGLDKFTGVFYTQYKGEYPVFRADVRMLTRNETGYPLVLISSSIRNLGDFTVDPGFDGVDASSKAASFSDPEYPDLAIHGTPRKVVYAGVGDTTVTPSMAIEFVAMSGSDELLYIIEAFTGEMLYRENLIVFTDVIGDVEGMATTGPAAEHCSPEAATGLPFAGVSILGGGSAIADEDGHFVIPNGGTTTVTVESGIEGQWFYVTDMYGPNSVLYDNVTPPGPAYFLHNQANSGELEVSQVNAYIAANVIRSFALAYNPSYPGLQNQMPIYVNRTDLYCPGNAWYSPSLQTINFCLSGDYYGTTYGNTAFSSVVYHEYGHHLVAMGGSGQGQYGEGIGDIMSVLLLDNPDLGLGFYYNNCSQPLRDAENHLDYPCSGVHACAELFSGCIWDTRNALAVTSPSSYLDILGNLTINSIFMHSGTEITPQITLDFLTLDDDDGNLYNGTPHLGEIYTGFDPHNMWNFSLTPIVLWTDPEQGEEHVPVESSISVKFNTAMNASTINYSTFLVTGSLSGSISGTISYDNLTLVATFDPAVNFNTNETITVHLTSGIHGADGLALSDYYWDFSTMVPCANATMWETTWGDTLANHAYAAVQTSAGEYAFCGRSGPYDAAILESDIQLVKTDSCGQPLWAHNYGGTAADWSYSMDATEPDGGFIICGTTYSYGIGQSDIYLIKTDALGTVQWSQTHGTTGYDYGQSVRQTSDGGYIAVGDLGMDDFLVLKLDSYGNEVWSDTCFDYYGFEEYTPHEVIETSSGHFVVVGTGYDDYFAEYFITLYTWDAGGNQVGWHNYYYDYGHGYGVVQTSDGGFIICGSVADTAGYNAPDFFLLKLDAGYNISWTKSYDVGNRDILYSVKQLPDGGYIATGETGYLYDGADMYVIRTNASGNIIWTKTYGGVYHDEGRSVQLCSDGGFVFGGNTYSLGDAENGDFYMVKMGPEPPAPVLVSPYNGQYWITTGMSVTLDWQDVPDAIYYQVLLDDNSDFSSPLANPDDIPVSTWTTPTLPLGTYYWKVRAQNETGWGPWSSARYFRLTTSSGCPVLYSFDGNQYREENPLLTACEKSNFTEVVTDYYHLRKPPACEDGRVSFQLREMVDEVSYVQELELITVDHSAEVNIACAVDGSIMAYNQVLTPLSAVDDQGRDRLAEVVAEDGLLFRATEPGSLTLTFPNTGADVNGFSFYALKKPDIEIEQEPNPKTVAGLTFTESDLTIEILGDDGTWHLVEAQIPSRANLLQEMVLTDDGSDAEVITVRLSWNRCYATDVLLQYIPAEEIPIAKSWSINTSSLTSSGSESGTVSGLSKENPLVLRKGDIFEYAFEAGTPPPQGLSRDYIIRAVGRYEPDNGIGAGLPSRYQLYNNYPNPFNPATIIAYDLPKATWVRIDVYNILGQLVTTLVNGSQDAGHQTVTWDGRDGSGRSVASGIYLYRLSTEAFTDSRKMVLLK